MDDLSLKIEATYLVYRDKENGFSVINARVIDSTSLTTKKNITVVGNFLSVNIGDNLKVFGEWINSNRGMQYKVKSYETILPSTEKAMAEYLIRTAPGVGKKKAKAIVSVFKENTINVIKSDWERLLQVPGIGMKTAKKVSESISSNLDFEELAMFLLPMNVSHKEVLEIYDNFGKGAINIIRANPYSLYGIKGIRFQTLDKIAMKTGMKHNEIPRIKAGIEDFIKYRMNTQGDLYIHRRDIMDNLNFYLKRKGNDSFGTSVNIDNSLISDAIEEMEDQNKIKVEVNGPGDECIYISYYNFIENQIVKNISEMIKKNSGNKLYNVEKIFETIILYEEKSNIKLAKSQKQAVIMALTNKVSILSGGPGTGKTQTTNAIIFCYKYLNEKRKIKLAAPTGRAAKRMTELTGRHAETIHRMIGLNEFSEQEEDFELDADFLIIDEASMIDAYVFYKLLTALSPFCKMLIVGDHEQLPSVGPGLILRDLINSEVVPTTKLSEIFRQVEGSKIIFNSQSAIKGNKEDIVFDSNSDGEFFFINRRTEDAIVNGIISSIENLMKNKNYILDDIQVLSVMNKGTLGTIELNKVLQSKFNHSKYSTSVGDKLFKENDKVMHIVNNYDVGVFNGDVGVITKIVDGSSSKNKEIYVDYGDKDICYTGEMLYELTLAYATTVHKSQGCEYKAIIMPFHKSLEILLTKNMINTGWTRAKELVVCLGDLNELYKAIDRDGNVIRNSLIKDKLKIAV